MLEDEIRAHARDEYPNECCGLVVAAGKRHRLVRGRNLALNPRRDFDLDPDAWLEVGDGEEVVAIYHSHPDGSPQPSLADLAGCEASAMPWYIVAWPSGDLLRVEPSGFEAPYEQRPYVHGVHDCYSIVRDWYRRELALSLPNYHRQDGWWDQGKNLYLDNFKDCGFVEVEGDPQRHDVFLIQIGSQVPNHAAIYLGDGKILHHAYGRLSKVDPWGGYWLKHRYSTLRHKSRIGNG